MSAVRQRFGKPAVRMLTGVLLSVGAAAAATVVPAAAALPDNDAAATLVFCPVQDLAGTSCTAEPDPGRPLYRSFGADGYGIDPDGAVRAAQSVAEFDADHYGYGRCVTESQYVKLDHTDSQGNPVFVATVYVRCRRA